MNIANTLSDLQKFIKHYNPLLLVSSKLVFVPTMGNLHLGHISLIKKALLFGDFVVVSIFVNKQQFAEHEDFDTYPRSLDGDINLIKNSFDYSSLKKIVIYSPDYNQVYQSKPLLQFNIPSLTSKLCGISRPHFFNGVTQVLLRLFLQVKPSIVILGEKDYQQFLVVKQFASEVFPEISIISGKTQREESGLALSSRNSYLNQEQKQIASLIFKSISLIADILKHTNQEKKLNSFVKLFSLYGKFNGLNDVILNLKLDLARIQEDNLLSNFAIIKNHFIEIFKLFSFEVDYLEIYNQEDLSCDNVKKDNARIFIACKYQGVRLIDNLGVID